LTILTLLAALDDDGEVVGLVSVGADFAGLLAVLAPADAFDWARTSTAANRLIDATTTKTRLKLCIM